MTAKTIAKIALNALPIGIGRATKTLLQEVEVFARHLIGRHRARLLSTRTKIKLHVGCGDNIKPGWVNVGFSKSADLGLDLREPIPLPDRSCSIIFSEHVVEHLYPEDAKRFFAECFRLLEPGGKFSAGVPDAGLQLRQYAADDHGAFESVKARWNPDKCETPMEVVNYTFRQGDEHKFAYDYLTFEKWLREAGFNTVRQREHNPGLDTGWRKSGSLYVEAMR